MGIGACDSETNFTWRTIRNNTCLLKPSTMDAISQIIVAEEHAIVPEAVEQLRVDSFVMQTNIHYPTESSLIRDGLRKFIQICLEYMSDRQFPGWRQQAFL